MLRGFFALVVLLSLLVDSQAVTALAQANPQQEDADRLKLTGKLSEIGIGEKARVEVTLRDKSKIKGYVAAVTPDTFTVKGKDQDRTIAYDDVKDIRKQGRRMWPFVVGITAGFGYLIFQEVIRPAFGG